MNQDANSDYSITNDHDRNSECGSDSKKEAMGKGNSLNESLPGSAPQKRYFTQMGKSIKQLTGKYFDMIRESIGSATSLLALYRVAKLMKVFAIRNLILMWHLSFFPLERRISYSHWTFRSFISKYLQYFFEYYFSDKYLVRKIVKYSRTHQSI